MQALSQTELQPRKILLKEKSIYHPVTLLSKASHATEKTTLLANISIKCYIFIMHKFIILVIFVLSINTAAFADNPDQVITLRDGSQIKGQLVGINNGSYTIQVPVVGDVHASMADVVSVTNANAPTLATQPTTNQQLINGPNYDQQIAANQKQLMSDPQSMELLHQMMQDPETMKLLQDPSLIKAVTSRDYGSVQNNPSVQKLLNSPSMQAILQRLMEQQRQQNAS